MTNQQKLLRDVLKVNAALRDQQKMRPAAARQAAPGRASGQAGDPVARAELRRLRTMVEGPTVHLGDFKRF